MGLIDKVNVEVNGSGDVLSTLSTYTTRILKPNIVDGRNVLTQAMISSKNTKYVIKYDFELDEDITVPANCVLEFDGGSINASSEDSRTITGNNTIIHAGLTEIFGNGVIIVFAGTWNVPTLYPIWFGVDETDVSLNPWYAFRVAILNIKPKEVRFDGEYHPNGLSITGISDCTLNFGESKVYGQTDSIDGNGTVLGLINCSNVTIKGGTFIARYFEGTHNGSVKNNCISISGKNVIVDGVTCYQENQDVGGRGIDLQGELLEDITIVNCTCYNGENGIDVLPITGCVAKNIVISNCNLISNYQGVLVNVGGYGKYAQNITISDINIESPRFRGLDIRGVHQLSVSNVNIKDCKSTGIYTNLVDGTIKGVNVIANDVVSTLHYFEPVGIYINESVPNMFHDYTGQKPLILTNFYIAGNFDYAISLKRTGMIISNGQIIDWNSNNFGIDFRDSNGVYSFKGHLFDNISYKNTHELIVLADGNSYTNIFKQVYEDNMLKTVSPHRNEPIIPYGGRIVFPTYLGNTSGTNYSIVHEAGTLKIKNTAGNNTTAFSNLGVLVTCGDVVYGLLDAGNEHAGADDGQHRLKIRNTTGRTDCLAISPNGKLFVQQASIESNNIQLIGQDGTTRYRIYVDNNGQLQCVTV